VVLVLTLSEVIDIVVRRLRYLMKEDNILSISADLSCSVVKLLIILDEDLNDEKLTDVTLRYVRILDDMQDTLKVIVLNKTNNYKRNKNTYFIWKKKSGFVGIIY